MHSPARIDTYSAEDLFSQTEHSPNQTRLFNGLRALDRTRLRTSLDDFNASLSDYCVANAPAPVYDPALIVVGCEGYHQAGQLEYSGATTYNTWKRHDSYSQYRNSYPLAVPQDQYFVPQDCHYYSSYIGYSNPSLHSTRQELNVNSHFDSLCLLNVVNINTGALNCDSPSVYVMQQTQEPSDFNASGYYIPTQKQSDFITAPQGSATSPFSALHPDPTIPHPTSVSYETSFPVPVSNPTSLPTPPAPISSFPPSLPSSQLIQLLPAPALREPSKKKRVHQPQSRKPAPARARKPNARSLPNGRSPAKSVQWLNKYMPRGSRCTLCQRGPDCDRLDRRLEHLASTHILQVVKNVGTFDADHFGISRGNLISTKAQFDLARQYVETLQCSGRFGQHARSRRETGRKGNEAERRIL